MHSGEVAAIMRKRDLGGLRVLAAACECQHQLSLRKLGFLLLRQRSADFETTAIFKLGPITVA